MGLLLAPFPNNSTNWILAAASSSAQMAMRANEQAIQQNQQLARDILSQAHGLAESILNRQKMQMARQSEEHNQRMDYLKLSLQDSHNRAMERVAQNRVDAYAAKQPATRQTASGGISSPVLAGIAGELDGVQPGVPQLPTGPEPAVPFRAHPTSPADMGPNPILPPLPPSPSAVSPTPPAPSSPPAAAPAPSTAPVSSAPLPASVGDMLTSIDADMQAAGVTVGDDPYHGLTPQQYEGIKTSVASDLGDMTGGMSAYQATLKSLKGSPNTYRAYMAVARDYVRHKQEADAQAKADAERRAYELDQQRKSSEQSAKDRSSVESDTTQATALIEQAPLEVRDRLIKLRDDLAKSGSSFLSSFKEVYGTVSKPREAVDMVYLRQLKSEAEDTMNMIGEPNSATSPDEARRYHEAKAVVDFYNEQLRAFSGYREASPRQVTGPQTQAPSWTQRLRTAPALRGATN